MFDWLFEGQLVVYVVLAVAAAALLAIWFRTDRRRGWLYAAGAVVVLIGVYALLDRLVETRREQIERKLLEMAAAVKNRDAARIFEHISDQFDYKGIKKASFRAKVERILKDGEVTKLTIWNVTFLDDKGKVMFQAKPEGPIIGENIGTWVHADFVLENGQWRMRTFDVKNPFVNTDQSMDVSPFLK